MAAALQAQTLGVPGIRNRWLAHIWLFPAIILGSAAGLSVFADGIVQLHGYLQLTLGLAGPVSLMIALAVVLLESLIAFCLLWGRFRRLGWILTGGFSATCAPFHSVAWLTDNTRACPCFGVDVFWGGRGAHAALAVLCIALFLSAVVGGRVHSRSYNLD